MSQTGLHENSEDNDYQAIDYYEKFRGTIFVIFVSEKLIDDKALVSEILLEIKMLIFRGIKCILVHGGGRQLLEINRISSCQSDTSLPYISKSNISSVLKAVKEINKQIISLCQKADLSHASLPRAVLGNKLLFHGEIGQVLRVDEQAIKVAIDSSLMPIIPSYCFDGEGNCLFVDSEYLSAEVGRSLKAQKLILITEKDGLQIFTKYGFRKLSFIDFRKLFSLIKGANNCNELLVDNMTINTVESCLRAVTGDVKQVHIIEGTPGALLQEILTKTGVGTLVEYNSVLEIRFPAKENDLDAIFGLRGECSKAVTEAGVPLLKPRLPKDIYATLQSTLCMDHLGVTVGTAFFTPLKEEPQTARIEGFVIGENFQDSGYGKLLLKACLEKIWQHGYSRAVAFTASSQAKSLFLSESSNLLTGPTILCLEQARKRFGNESHLLEAFTFLPQRK